MTVIFPPVMLDLMGAKIREDEKELLTHPKTGGVILFTRNFVSKMQIADLCHEIRSIADRNILIAVDHEGGRVQRFRDGFSAIPPMSNLGKLYNFDQNTACDYAQKLGWLMANELRSVGIDFSFAPILDIDIGLSEVIGNRAFHHTVDGVVNLANAWIDGMHKAGMAATGKHFPGHGGVQADSHITIPRDTRSVDAIRTHDLIPFERIKTMNGVMPAHVIYTDFDPLPAGFSKVWLQGILRDELGFDGVIFSDDLSMHGASIMGDYTTRAKSALDAGCDMILVCNNPSAATEVLIALDGFEQPSRSSQRMACMIGQPAQVDWTDQAQIALVQLDKKIK